MGDRAGAGLVTCGGTAATAARIWPSGCGSELERGGRIADVGDGPTSVYLARSAAGELLYVGITGQGAGRLCQHAQSSAWWCEAQSLEIEHYPTRARALRRETELIKAERPPHNVAGKATRRLCSVCEWELAIVGGRCRTCDTYWRRTGRDRSEELIVKHGARVDPKARAAAMLLAAVRDT